MFSGCWRPSDNGRAASVAGVPETTESVGSARSPSGLGKRKVKATCVAVSTRTAAQRRRASGARNTHRDARRPYRAGTAACARPSALRSLCGHRERSKEGRGPHLDAEQDLVRQVLALALAHAPAPGREGLDVREQVAARHAALTRNTHTLARSSAKEGSSDSQGWGGGRGRTARARGATRPRARRRPRRARG